MFRFRQFFSPSLREKLHTGKSLLNRLLCDRADLLIIEDRNELKSAFENELQFVNDIDDVTIASNHSIFDIIKYIISAFIALFAALFFDYFLVLTIFLISVFVTSALILYKKRYQKFFCDTFDLLSQQLQKEKKLYKNVVQLLEDFAVFNHDNRIHESRMHELKKSFRDIGLKCFVHTRECTKSLRVQFPLKAALDDDDSLICSLPDESLESYQNDEELTLKTIKALEQLIRLQISELLKRVLFLFEPNNYLDTNLFDSNFYRTLQSKLFRPLLKETEIRQKELLSVIYFHKLFYKQPIVREETKLISTSTNYWALCRNVRKSIYSSLSIIDVCESLVADLPESQISKEVKETFENKLALLITEISNAQSDVQCILKILRLKDLKHKTCSSSEIKLENESNHSEVNSIAFPDVREKYVVQDQVFEAYIPEMADYNVHCGEDNNDFDLRTEIGNSASVFRELKHALKAKAIEHKAREAKALGKTVDLKKLEEEYVNNIIDKEEEEGEERITKKKHISADSESIKNQTISHLPSMGLSFNLNIAMQARDKMRLLLDVNEETFGDNCQSDGSESTED